MMIRSRHHVTMNNSLKCKCDGSWQMTSVKLSLRSQSHIDKHGPERLLSSWHLTIMTSHVTQIQSIYTHTHKTSSAVRSRYNSEMIQERNVAGTFSVLLQFIWHNSNELLIFRASAPPQWPRRPSPLTIIIVITRNMRTSPHLPHLPHLNLHNGWGWVLLCTTTDTTTIDNWMEQWWRGWGQRGRVQTSVQSRYSRYFRYSRIMNNNQNQLATKIQLEGDTYMIGRSALWIVSWFLWCNMKRF